MTPRDPFLIRQFIVKRLRRAPIIQPLWDEFERMTAERDAALAARDTASMERDAALAARDTALSERTLAARDTALSECDGLCVDKLIDAASNCDSFLAAFDQLWELNPSYEACRSMEEALDLALQFHPDNFRLNLYKAIMPLRKKEWMDTAQRCLKLAENYPNSHWPYLWGVPSAIAVADYETAAAFTELALPHFHEWTPEFLLTMISNICQTGDDRSVGQLWGFLLRQYPSEVRHIFSVESPGLFITHVIRRLLPMSVSYLLERTAFRGLV